MPRLTEQEQQGIIRYLQAARCKMGWEANRL
jgi:hypothetical protein